MFGHKFAQQQRSAPNFVRMSLWITLHDVALGGKRPVAVGTPRGQTSIEVEIPLGINDGDNVQYQGLAPGGQDLVIQYRIHPDPVWQREGLNLVTEVVVDIWQMILGGELKVNTITGSELAAHIPARTQPRTTLRLRQQGLKDRAGNQGDLMVRVMPRIPENIRPELIEAIEKYRE
jgi:DnaJ-class molecular chaperone